MASRYPPTFVLHFDASCATIRDEDGDLAGVLSFSYGAGLRVRGRVRAPGSRSPIDYINGALVLAEGRLVMYRREAGAWIKKLKDTNPGAALSDVVRSFTITYAPLDEEGFLLPAQVDSFQALIDPPRGLGADMGQATTPLTVEIGLFLISKVRFNGVEID